MDWTYSLTKKMERLLKAIRKKSPHLHAQLSDAQESIVKDLLAVGKLLKGDLKGLMSYDFNFKGIGIRICYVVQTKDKHITFVFCGTRENFYREVKNYLFD